jgi:hypothetical protein
MVINTVINLEGRWKISRDTHKTAIISVSSPSIIIDLSAWGLPTAFGMVLNDRTITVTFPKIGFSEGKNFTGKLEQPNSIRWSDPPSPGVSVWTKPINVDVERKLEQNFGFWNSTGKGTPRAKISVESSSIRIDMSAFGRPTAHGSINDDGSITVSFPDDRSYTGKLDQPGRINWSNGTVWKTVFVEG